MQSQKKKRQLRIIAELKAGRELKAGLFVRMIQKEYDDGGSIKPFSEKTFYRDIKDLQENTNAPIACDRAGRDSTYTLLSKDWTIADDFLLTEDQLMVNLLSMKIARDYLPGTFQEDFDESRDMQFAALPPDRNAARQLETFITASDQQAVTCGDYYNDIIEAWRHQKQIEISYKKPQGEESTRVIDVYALYLDNQSWYCLTFCNKAREARTFALHRMTSCQLLETTFVRRKDISEKAKSGKVFNWDYVDNIHLLCSKEKSQILSEKEHFPGQETVFPENGQLELLYKSAPEQQIIAWILAQGGEVQVLEPESLKQIIREKAEKILKQYS